MNRPPISLENARKLVSLIEAGNNQAAYELLDETSQNNSLELFSEVGKLTRQLHDSLNNFQLDPRIVDMANQSIPDAKTRLSYVMQTTEDAANKTMDIVDTCMPIVEKLAGDVGNLEPEWDKLLARNLQLGEFNQLTKDIGVFFKEGNQALAKLSQLLTEVLLAQGYQDITGQVIRKVIEIVKEVEDSLVHMLAMFGGLEVEGSDNSSEKPNKSEKQVDSINAEGPIMDAKSREDVASDQDDVDDLLSSLGF
ncbi:protein phosphatase CheZ [Paraglaciecola aquimarina]|uniref:Protein phosphatase CheZ n=1 Tax=Paraglaciecola aquimarina TaxID=1235557 RepID=A0ABU3T090_9ALTE|nr:protein phosphatase CheZ [Paraglaciecola aquimarina]MDU0355680.1 protein phosphatase CheZ [Paraglaciecola aquimarina]